MQARPFFGIVIAALVSSVSLSCIDPVHSDDVAALGNERTGVAPGPTHRPGQPCRVCHGGTGPGKPEFIIAGTVYLKRGNGLPAQGVDVVISDGNKNELRRLRSNEVGNFYVSTDDWKPGPTFPLFSRLEYGGTVKEMQTAIGRRGDCSFCHYGADGEKTHMPPLYLTEPTAP